MYRFLIILPPLLAMLVSACSTSEDDASDRLARVFDSQAAQAEQMGDYAAAAKHYTALLRTRGADVRILAPLARALRLSGKPNDALALIEQMLAQRILDTDQADAAPLMLEYGKLRLIAGQAEAALVPLTHAAALQPRDWEAPAMRGVALDRLGRFDEADGAYRQALAVFPAGTPGSAEVLNNYGLSRALAGRLDEAIALLERAVALPDAGPQVRQNLTLLSGFRNRTVPAGTASPLAGIIVPGGPAAAPTTPVGSAPVEPVPGQRATAPMAVPPRATSPAVAPHTSAIPPLPAPAVGHSAARAGGPPAGRLATPARASTTPPFRTAKPEAAVPAARASQTKIAAPKATSATAPATKTPAKTPAATAARKAPPSPPDSRRASPRS